MADLIKTDSLDVKLMELLAVDARQTSDQLARQLKVSPSTVRRRMQQLIENGVLHIIGVADTNRMGKVLNVIIALNIANSKVASAMDKLAGMRGVQWVIRTTGRYDILIHVRFRSIEELSHFLANELASVDGLEDSETFICLNLTAGTKRQIML